MKVLHIVRHLEDDRAMETAREHAREHQVTLLLLHDAVLNRPAFAGKVYACQTDVEARSLRGDLETVSYPDIVRLVFENDKVVVW